MALISALPVLDRSRGSAPVEPVTEVETTEAAPPGAPTTGGEVAEPEAEDAVAVSPRRVRRLPHPPGRRGPLWLAALVTGAVLASLPSVHDDAPESVVVSASDYGLRAGTDAGLSGGLDDAVVRRGLTEAEAQVRLQELAASRAAREPDFALPLAGRETTCFCTRWGQFHPGLDIAAPLGTPIVAASDGVVLSAGPASGYGYAIYLQDTENNVQIYGHMRYLNVEAGQTVRAGDLVAWVGNEGRSTGPHLHFQVEQGGSPVDPAEWLRERGVPYSGA